MIMKLKFLEESVIFKDYITLHSLCFLCCCYIALIYQLMLVLLLVCGPTNCIIVAEIQYSSMAVVFVDQQLPGLPHSEWFSPRKT